LPVGGLGHDRDVLLGFEQRTEAAADQRLVVGEQYPDHADRSRGSSACTVYPPSARGPARSRPPRAVTRSRIPRSPTPKAAVACDFAAPSSSTRMTRASGRYNRLTVAVAA